jgi:uncharacterized protein involved in response to NO
VDIATLPAQWREAHRRDAVAPPALPDPLPERRLARLLAAYVVTGLVFLVLPGTVLGVWNLIGISSGRELAAVSTAWIQAHGHAQFFGWVATFLIGISVYTLPKFRGAATRSVPVGWAMWAMWTVGVGLRWAAGIVTVSHPAAFRISAALELAVGALLLWQVSAPGKRSGAPWAIPVFGGFGALVAVLGWQLWLTLQPLDGTALPAAPDRLLITLAIWWFAYPVVLGYCAKFFPGLLGTPAPHKIGLAAAAALALVAPAAAVPVAWWALRVFAKRSRRFPSAFPRLAYLWLGVAAALGLWAARPGMLGASRHAFTVGFLATLIFSIGPRILPSFLNSRELWSARAARAAVVLLTAGCTLRVVSEPLAYGEIVPVAWKALPVSAFLELAAVLLFAFNIARSLATPVPSWFGHKHVNDRMSVYWLVSAYPGTRRVMIDAGLATLARAQQVPKSLTVREAAEADGVPADALVEQLGAFFDARLPHSLRSASTRSTKK